jgi:uncharacterized protein involved in exopolysaccharide biosynthesis
VNVDARMAKLAAGAIAASLLAAAIVTAESLLQTLTYGASARVRVNFRKRSDKQTNQTGSGEQFQTLQLPSEGRRQLIRTMVTDAKRARQAVSTLAEVASEDRVELDFREAGATPRATVYEKARAANAPASPKPLRNGLLALVVGLALSVALVSRARVLEAAKLATAS